jgi:hypothetical protein
MLLRDDGFERCCDSFENVFPLTFDDQIAQTVDGAYHFTIILLAIICTSIDQIQIWLRVDRGVHVLDDLINAMPRMTFMISISHTTVWVRASR